ncbi:recombinase family protein [Streptomyces sp. NBC_01565]|uniref:recombinase family protein n=1 Tax=Streptomyces sp. NBC_01565 TaxID=2975881 RepID=UPI002258F4FE|nr:recombinase family protein [Streptomyces sp. NBC_01565]MCX4540515.1 recombinase family protein [Streptomyces sp. NBC_01565]
MGKETLPRRVVRCFIYARISQDRECAGIGTGRQIDDCYQLAEQLSTTDVEYKVVRVFEDNDMSAYSGKPRPDYREMLTQLREGAAECVLAMHTDRLHRSPAELETYIDVCEPRRVETRTVRAGFLDLATAAGRMIARQLGVQARYEVERMAERQMRAREDIARKGDYLGGPRPFGWEADGVTPREPEYSLIRDAAHAVMSGVSLRAVCADWARQGITTSMGNQWTASTLREMLRRPRNIGMQVHRGEEVGQANWTGPLEGEEALFRGMLALFQDPSRLNNPRRERKWLGSSIYLCGRCGDTLKATSGSMRTTGSERATVAMYKCRSSTHIGRNAERLDDYVQLVLLERLGRPDAVDLLARKDEPVDSRAAQGEITQARATLDQLAQALGEGTLDLRTWNVASAAARQRLSAAEAVLARAVRMNPAVGLVGEEDVEAAWAALDLSRRRAVLAHLMEVTVMPAKRGPGWDASAIRIAWK